MVGRILASLFISSVLFTALPSCNSNKIACPTYADSFPEAKNKKKKKEEPQMPKTRKATSGLLPANARHK
jgi:hypothetical protein